MSAINDFLLKNNLRIATNPCVSPDFCLDWPALSKKALSGESGVHWYYKSRFATTQGEWTLFEDMAAGDCGWRLSGANGPTDILEGGVDAIRNNSRVIFPATWANLLKLKNL